MSYDVRQEAETFLADIDRLESKSGRFYCIVAHLQRAREAERERCAQVCRARAEAHRQERERWVSDRLRDALEEEIAECEACAEAIKRGEP